MLVAEGISLSILASEVYDPETGTWTAAGSLIGFRESFTATLLPKGKVLVAGGRGPQTGPLASAHVYDPATGAWTATGSLSEGRYRHTATPLANGTVLVAGGFGANPFGTVFASAQVYDPATGTWTATGSMIGGRHYHTATRLPNGKVLVAGGLAHAPASAEIYDPATGNWTVTGSLIGGRYQHTATLLPNGKVLVAGGIGDSGVLCERGGL